MPPAIPDRAPLPTPEFPLRVAAVDVGSNAIRFLAAEFSDPTTFARLDYVRAPVRLGASAFGEGALDEETMERAVATLAGFRRRMEALEIRHYRAVATSAVRDSSNGAAFVHRVHDEAGLRLEAITGTEEARLVWLAIRNRFPLDGGEWILVDLGGGSVEVSLVDAEGVHWSESHLLGTVRLLAELRDDEEASPQRFRRLLEDHTAMLKISSAARDLSPRGMLATGGNMEELASLSGAEADARGVRVVPVAELRDTIRTLAELTPAERVRKLGLREDRADVILPAAVVYERMAVVVGAEEIVVPDVGVKEGVLLDLVDDLVEHGSHELRLEQEIMAGAVALGRRYQFDEPHARHVALLALALYDQLRERHQMGEEDRRILLAAALLHDIGQFISYRRHHKHSYYLISNADLPGFAPAQIQLVALVARYHRRAEPRESHDGYGELDRDDRARIEQLASLLRIADALDREHLQQVQGVEARVEDAELRLALDGAGDLVPEVWALKKKAQMFERVFEVELHVATAAERP